MCHPIQHSNWVEEEEAMKVDAVEERKRKAADLALPSLQAPPKKRMKPSLPSVIDMKSLQVSLVPLPSARQKEIDDACVTYIISGT